LGRGHVGVETEGCSTQSSRVLLLLYDLIIFLRCKGKRYRSKKERMRMEKGGPPYAADGSLDYAESGFFGMLSLFILRVVLIVRVT
jgi:hypothetical protein